MISVCLATYNGSQYIEPQIRSILSELAATDEVIVTDDGSSDETIQKVRSFGDPRIRIIKNEGVHGVNGNFNNGLQHCKGEIIFLADQDDYWLPGKVSHCVEALKEADLVVHDAIITDSELHSQNKTLFYELDIKEGFISNLLKNRFTGCCMAFRREVLDYIMPIPTGVKFFHDNWIGLMVELKGRVKFIEFPGIYFRRHAETSSTAGGDSGLTIADKMQYRLALLLNLLKRKRIK